MNHTSPNAIYLRDYVVCSRYGRGKVVEVGGSAQVEMIDLPLRQGRPQVLEFGYGELRHMR